MQEPVLEVKNISFKYSADSSALDRFSMKVFKNQIVGLMAPNGGGKSTLFGLLTGLLQCKSSEIFYGAQDFYSHASLLKAKLGVVFQNPSLDKKMTVLENIIYQGKLFGLKTAEIKSRAQGMLELFLMADRAHARVETLSGGLARRVEIIKSMIHDPEILILDEPSTGLDIFIRQELWSWINQLRVRHNTSILLTTHFIEEAEKCDHVYIMHLGKNISDGTPVMLKSQYHKQIVSLKPKNMDQIKTLLTRDLNIPFLQNNNELTFKLDPSKMPQALQALTREVDELSFRSPSLEDVFIQLTQAPLRNIN